MSDFTKEELQHILGLTIYCSAGNSNEQLTDKIQTMIDNYCDHETDQGGSALIYSMSAKNAE